MDNSELLNQLNYIHVVIILISAVFGFIKGFIKHFSKTSALFYSGIIAIFFTPHVTLILDNRAENILSGHCSSFIISYLIVFIIFMLIISTNEKDKRACILSISSRFLGTFVGILRGFFISVGLCVFILTFEIQKNKISMLKSSKISSTLFIIAEYWMPLSNKTNMIIEPKIKEIQKEDKSIRGKTIKVEVQPKPEKEKTPKEETVEKTYSTMKYVANFFANILSGLKKVEEEIETDYYVLSPKNLEIDKQNFIRAEYGCMSLFGARIRRIAERKKELIEQNLLRHMEINLDHHKGNKD